jgi:hypothetical protein
MLRVCGPPSKAMFYLMEDMVMRSRRLMLLCVWMGVGLLALASTSVASTLQDANLFSGRGVATSSTYPGLDYPGSYLTDGGTAVHIFADGSAVNQAAIYGFGSGINTIRFWDGGWGPRTPSSVEVYYSSDPAPTSFDPFFYYGTYALPTTGDFEAYPTNPSSNPGDLVGAQGRLAHYSEITGLNIPYTTRSVWFKFPGVTSSNYGSAMSEIQGFGPAIGDVNVLQGKAVVASNTYWTESGVFNASFATDGTGNQQVFADFGDDQRMVVHGINSGFNTLRLWRDPEAPRVPARALIKSSTTDTSSLDASFYDMTLTNLSSLAFNEAGYVDILVNAPAGTQSLYLDFGVSDSLGGEGHGVRVVELQAFNLAGVPEPSSLAILSCGLVGLVAYGWRKRK